MHRQVFFLRLLLTALSASGLALVASSVTLCQDRDGGIDTRFAVNGFLNQPLESNEMTFLDRDAFIQPDGKIVIGYDCLGASPGFGGCVFRYFPDGSLDGKFGVDGRVTTPYGFVFGSLTTQTDGKFLVGGYYYPGQHDVGVDFAIVRYAADGTLDPTFGSGGMALTDFGSFEEPSDDVVRALFVLPDAKVLAVGASYVRDQHVISLAMARYLPDGSIDSSFGQRGLAKHLIQSIGPSYEWLSVAAQNDGHILIAKAGNTTVTRYNADGSLDTSFSKGGSAIIDRGTIRLRMRLLNSGKILLVSTSELIQLNSDGSLDETFGKSGVRWVNNSHFYYNDVIQDDHGRLIAVGYEPSGYEGGYYSFQSIVSRFLSNGEPDPSFGDRGSIIAQQSEGFTELRRLLLDHNGKILTIGSGGFFYRNTPLVVRIINQALPFATRPALDRTIRRDLVRPLKSVENKPERAPRLSAMLRAKAK